ncbi:MAG: hypothetical protein WDM85_17680 [Caulobacteraceae bacterium]
MPEGADGDGRIVGEPAGGGQVRQTFGGAIAFAIAGGEASAQTARMAAAWSGGARRRTTASKSSLQVRARRAIARSSEAMSGSWCCSGVTPTM